jgi:hypothetical protein
MSAAGYMPKDVAEQHDACLRAQGCSGLANGCWVL